jgi:hypothetical protein
MSLPGVVLLLPASAGHNRSSSVSVRDRTLNNLVADRLSDISVRAFDGAT